MDCIHRLTSLRFSFVIPVVPTKLAGLTVFTRCAQVNYSPSGGLLSLSLFQGCIVPVWVIQYETYGSYHKQCVHAVSLGPFAFGYCNHS